MRETKSVSRVNIGTASIVLILMILCLAVFSLLSLSDARSSLTFAERRAQSVQAFYAADAQVQKWVSRIQGLDYPSAVRESDSLLSELPEGSSITEDEETGLLTLTVPLSQGQSLTAEYSAAKGQLLSSQVFNSEDYAIDTRLPVWTGNETP